MREDRLKEIRRLSEESEKADQLQIPVFPELEGIDIGFDVEGLKNSQDTKRSYKIFSTIQRLLIDHLPKGKDQKNSEIGFMKKKMSF